MKLDKKDVIYVILAAIMFSITGLVIFSQILHKPSGGGGVSVEVIDPIQPTLDSNALSTLNDPSKAKDYTVPVDLTTGLGNSAPFGP